MMQPIQKSLLMAKALAKMGHRKPKALEQH
jgi:hypothetical protein